MRRPANILALACLVAPLYAQLPTCNSLLFTPCDLVFQLDPAEASTRNFELRAEFRSPHRDTIGIYAFEDSPGRWVMRFTPNEVGQWDYRVTSSVDRLNQQIGRVFGVAPAPISEKEPAPVPPGFLEVNNVYAFWTGSDLQPHLWMSAPLDNFTTIPAAEFDQFLSDRAAEHFNHIRVTIGDATDLAAAARRIRAINENGMIADLVLAAIPPVRREREPYLRELIARFAPFDITWAMPPFEQIENGRTILFDAGSILKQWDPYHHLRTSLAEITSAPLLEADPQDNWQSFLSYGTADPNVGAVERQFYLLPAINTGIASRADLWNATMNGHYPASGLYSENAAREYQVWAEIVGESRYWELQPYFDLDGGRALAMHYMESGRNQFEAVEYLVYVPQRTPVEMVVEKHGYDVLWIDPATGERFEAKGFNEDRFIGEPPPGDHDWVLRVSREGRKRSMRNSYKFESRPVVPQQIESRAEQTPYEVSAPEGDITVRLPPFYELEITRPSRATRDLLVEWTVESTSTGEGFRVTGTGMRGTMQLPAAVTGRVPTVLSLRVSILNSYGKAYSVDRAIRLVP